MNFISTPEPLCLEFTPADAKLWPVSSQWWHCDRPDQQNKLRSQDRTPTAPSEGSPEKKIARRRGKSIKISMCNLILPKCQIQCLFCLLLLVAGSTSSRFSPSAQPTLEFGNRYISRFDRDHPIKRLDRSRFPICRRYRQRRLEGRVHDPCHFPKKLSASRYRLVGIDQTRRSSCPCC